MASRTWLGLSHSRSSFVLARASSGTGGDPRCVSLLPTKARIPAIPPSTTATIKAANHTGTASDSPTMAQATRAATARNPSAPATAKRAAPTAKSCP